MLEEELSAKTLGYANWNWILSVFTFDIITSAARLLIYVLEYNIYRGSWAKSSEVDSYLGTYCLWLIVFNEFHIATALVFCLSSRSYTKLLIAYIACSGAAVFCHVNPYVIELLRLAEYIYIVNVWTLTIHFVFIPITTIKCGLIIWVLWRTSKACPYYEEDEEGRLGIRNGVCMAILFVAYCVMGIVITIAHSLSGIGGIEISLWTSSGIASLNYLVLFLANFLLILFIIYVFIFPNLRKNSKTYAVSAVSTIAVGLILLSPIVFEYQELLKFYELYKELCIVQYVCASIFLVCGMFLTVILWKIRVVKPKIVKRKKKKPRKIKYKVIYGGEESSTNKMITVDCE